MSFEYLRWWKTILRGGLFGKNIRCSPVTNLSLNLSILILRMNLGIGSNLSRKPYWAYTQLQEISHTTFSRTGYMILALSTRKPYTHSWLGSMKHIQRHWIALDTACVWYASSLIKKVLMMSQRKYCPLRSLLQEKRFIHRSPRMISLKSLRTQIELPLQGNVIMRYYISLQQRECVLLISPAWNYLI